MFRRIEGIGGVHKVRDRKEKKLDGTFTAS